jgi:hypothetical protein
VAYRRLGRDDVIPAAPATGTKDTTIRKTGSPSDNPSPAELRELRAKYLDWCSAQVADHFLALSPDEIFEIAERAGGTDPRAGDRPFSHQATGVVMESLDSYRQIVERVTEVLTEQLDLPDFGAWLDLYRRKPAEVESRLLGLWRDVPDED